MPRIPASACALLVLCFTLGSTCAAKADEISGREIFANKCAECHGQQGQGVAGAADDPLYGSRSLADLTQVIAKTMPEGEPEACVGEEAERVARFMYDTFYTAQARMRNETARVELSRMTVPQYRQSVADLLGSFLGKGDPGQEQGLEAQYYTERRRRKDKLVIERVDPVLDFDFGGEAPGEGIDKKEFYVSWRGSLLAEESGEYEIILRTGNGARLWLNDSENKLIDAWVSSGGKVMEHRAKVYLLGGRAYPLELEFFKFRDKSAAIQLSWKPPHKAEQLIPPRQLRTRRVQPTFVVTTPFPPDDRSVGYERGTAVSQSWDEATTYAAIETAQFVVDSLDRLAGTRPEHKDRHEKWEKFCLRFVERALRHPLTEQEQQFFVKSQFAATTPEEAVKRVVLLTLKSPRFLYLGINREQYPSYATAAHLSFALWDSLPDEALLKAAELGQLHTQERVATQARRMLDHPLAHAKLRQFFHGWLMLDHAEDLGKNEEQYPEFTEQLIGDLRTSLDLLIDNILASPEADFRELLLSNVLPVNKRLAEFYEVGNAAELSNEAFQMVSVDSSKRAGVMTHPYLLAALAYRDNTSPIHRGVFLTRRIMNRALNPPPMAIEFNDSRFDPHQTMREKVTELTKATACQACHQIINPLGFSLEHFDAVGRYRETEKDKPIDAASDYTTVDGKTFRFTGPRDVAQYAVNSEQSQQGFVESLLHHAVKQPAAAYGEETLSQLRAEFVAANFSMRELLVDIMRHTALHGIDP